MTETPFFFWRQPHAAAEQHIEQNADGGHILRKNRSESRACDAERQYSDKEQIQCNVQHSRDSEKNQRHRRVSERAQHTGKEIVYGCCNKAGKDNQKIRPHAGTDFIRDAQKRKDRIDAGVNSKIQHKRNGKDQQKRVENRKF